MALPSVSLNTMCDIYRPFGSASPLTTGIPCQLVPDMAHGQPRLSGNLVWTHYLLVKEDVDIRDGCSRNAGTLTIAYTDGDKVVVPTGAGNTSYVVVWVEYLHRGSTSAYKRAYLLRDTAAWPGP